MGIDVHPGFQRGLNIEQVYREGFRFLSVKLCEGTSNTWEAMGSADWIRRGKTLGMSCLGYAYLQPGNIPEQARVFAGALARCGVPGVIDAEAITVRGGDTVPTLTIGMIRQFHTELRKLGAPIPLLYLPRWYWQRIGSPDLSGLPPLWGSSYPSTQHATASELYELVTPTRWASYGGLPVMVLQFAETALVAGKAIDANAYQGTPTDFARVTQQSVTMSTPLQRSDLLMTYRIDPTPFPLDTPADTRPTGTWTAVEHTISTPGPVGGWSGRVLQHLTAGWLGMFIQEAWSAPSGTHFVPRYDPKTNTGGKYVDSFMRESWEHPKGDYALIVRLATRAHVTITTETEH